MAMQEFFVGTELNISQQKWVEGRGETNVFVEQSSEKNFANIRWSVPKITNVSDSSV